MIGLSLNYCAAPQIKNSEPDIISPKTDTIKTVILGNENLILNYLNIIIRKNIGLLTNAAGVNSKLENSIDMFFNHPQIKLIKLFSPEHGIRGAFYAGDLVNDDIDTRTGLKIYSLYGKNRKPSKEMLADLNIILIDLQDTGVRSYTYIYSMAEVMKAAAQYGKKVFVLDRPNPLGGRQVEGSILESGFESFVGMYPIPYRYGMTIGELARLFNNEFKINCDLTIIPMRHWKRDMLWQDTGLVWVPTSPHIPNGLSPFFTCITGPMGELQTVSNGVGYTIPFELIGAPWIDAYELADALNSLNLTGVYFRPIFYKPYYAVFSGQNCQGVQIHLINPRECNLFVTGLYIMQTLINLYPEQNIFTNQDRLEMFNKVMGCDWILHDLQNNIPVHAIQNKWQDSLQKFISIREQYLIY
jgi:uncharacterized protein YbbC (DUF1343 family)